MVHLDVSNANFVRINLLYCFRLDFLWIFTHVRFSGIIFFCEFLYFLKSLSIIEFRAKIVYAFCTITYCICDHSVSMLFISMMEEANGFFSFAPLQICKICRFSGEKSGYSNETAPK